MAGFDDVPPDPDMGGAPSIAAGGPGMGYGVGGGYYGDAAAYQTTLRAGYGNSPLFAMGGIGGGQPMFMGGQNGLTTIGSHIRPLAYVPPAYVATGYTGRYVQSTGIMNDIRNLLGTGPTIRGARDYDISYNAGMDLGERAGLGLGGIGLALGESAAGLAASSAISAAVGGGFVGGAASLVGGAGAFMAAGKYTDLVRQAVTERRQIENYLGATSDRFFTASAAPGILDPRRGAGLSIESRREIAESIRQMDVHDPLLNTKDLTGILKGSVEAGMFSGTHDIADFKKKFKDIVENVKLISTTLHQTLEEGVKTLKDLRGIGIDPMEARNVVMNSETLGRVAGRSATEMMNLGLQGAELFRGTGVDMRVGFESNQMNLASIRAARDANMLSQEAIAQAGGEEQLAQRLTATGLGFMQSSMGRGLSGAFFTPGAGPGGFNAASFSQMLTGDQSIGSIAEAAARGLGSPKRLIEFQANQAKFMSGLGAEAGGQGAELAMMGVASSIGQTISRITGASVEDATKATLMTQMGVDDTTATAMLAKLKAAPETFRAAQASAEQTSQQQKIQEASQNFFLSRAAGQVGGFLKETFIEPVAGPINKLVDDVQTGVMNAQDRVLWGITRYDLSRTGADNFRGTASAAEVARVTANPLASIQDGRSVINDVNLDVHGLSASAGSDLQSVMDDATSLFKYRRDERGAVIVNDGSTVIGDPFTGVLVQGKNMLLHGSAQIRTTMQELKRNAALGDVLSRTVMQAEAAEAKDGSTIKADRTKVKEAFRTASAQNSEITDLGDLAKRAFGRDLKDLAPGSAEYDAILLETKDDRIFSKQVSKAQKDAATARAAYDSANVIGMADATTRAADAKAAVAQELREGAGRLLHVGGPDLNDAATAALARVAALTRPGAPKSTPKELADAQDAFRDAVRGTDAAGQGEALLYKAATSGDLQKALDDYATSYQHIDALQQAKGTAVLRSGIAQSLGGRKDRDQALAVVDRLLGGGAEAIAALNTEAGKADLKLLRGVPGAGTLTEEAKNMAFLKKAEDQGKGSDFVLSELNRRGVPTPQAAEVAQAFEHGGAREADAALHAGAMTQLAGTSGVSVAGASGGVNTATGNAGDTLAVQTATNLQTLALFQALAAKVYGIK